VSTPNLPQNYQLAVEQLRSTVKKLIKIPEIIKQYNEIIQDQLNKGVIVKVINTSTESLIKEHHKG